MTELRATYRLQLGPQMRFDDVRALVPYLRALGSVICTCRRRCRRARARRTATTSSTRRACRRRSAARRALRELAGAGLGIILDIVPNHMGTGDENRWWADPTSALRVFDVDPQTGHYRRFFDIDDLAGVRVEDPEVFELTHAQGAGAAADGVLDGLRVDHPDGLADPAGYLERLRAAGASRTSGSRRSCIPASRCATGR